MKWVFLSLLLANIGYFVYQWQQSGASTPDTTRHPDAATEAGVQLLSERSGQSDRQREARSVLGNPLQAAAGNPTPALVDDVPVQASRPVGQPESGQAVGKPLRVTETTDEDAPSATGPVQAVVTGDTEACWRLGAFTDLDAAQDIAERATALGATVEIKAIDAPTGEYDYRVLIPPMNSMQEAFRRLRELKSRNIDSYVMAQGENAQGISLGLFSTEDAAQRHQQDLAGLGYTVSINPIARVSRTYWIYTAAGRLPQTVMEELQSTGENVSQAETDCLN